MAMGWRRANSTTVLMVLHAMACLFSGVTSGSGQDGTSASTPPGPQSPEEAQRGFQLPPDWQIELVAAEPEVVDPVAIRFDEAGRLWVVEMRDYPHGPAAGEPPLSRIRWLEDRDGDGRFEHARLFADQLLFPTGLQPWKGGLIVTLAGQVAYLQDTDGDGRADRSEPWFEGFAQENSQLRANHPTLAIDNHIYIANGLRDGEVRDMRRPDRPVASIRSRDFRFDPLSSHCEPVSGLGQFGMTFDDFGRRFVCSNRNPARHVVLEDRYLARNPAVAVPEVVQDVAAAGERSRLFPLSRAWTTSTLHAGQFTAACGVLVYRGAARPEQFHQQIFVCDPTGNLVHREVMSPAGATFVSQPVDVDREFLATADEWFRPVNLEIGPDGAMYVVDMYRAVIEHPEFMPDELKTRRDLRWGDDRGRIWRVRARNAVRRPPATLATHTVPQLVEALRDPNGWVRDTASRLLLERQERSAAPLLGALATNAAEPAARVHALRLLEGLGLLEEPLVRQAIGDQHPAVREHAVVLSERWLLESADWRQAVCRLSGDDDPRVRFQAALSLTPVQTADEVAALAEIVLRMPGDAWTRSAVVLASGPMANQLARLVLQRLPHSGLAQDETLPLARELAQAAGGTAAGETAAGLDAELLDALLALAEEDATLRVGRAALGGLLDAWTRRRFDWRSPLARAGERRRRLERVLDSAGQTALQGDLPPDVRKEALQLARHATNPAVVAELALRRGEETSLRTLALEFAPQVAEPAFWEQLLQRYASESPAVRTAIVGAALARGDSTAWLLDAIEAGHVRAQELAAPDFTRLEQHPDAQVRERVARIAAARTPADRQQALARYQPCLELPDDPRRGRELFARHCATCHRVGSLGVEVAPDIADSRTKTPQQLLTDILQPNRAIDGNYIGYIVQTTDGRTLTGLLAAETGTSVTIRQQENKIESLRRDEIEVLRSTGVSLMPEGLEQNLSLQDMADLVSFIKNWRYLDGRTPLGGTGPDSAPR